jgi:hypothetical protein
MHITIQYFEEQICMPNCNREESLMAPAGDKNANFVQINKMHIDCS